MADTEDHRISKVAYYTVAALASVFIAFFLSASLSGLLGGLGEEGYSNSIISLLVMPLFYAGAIYGYIFTYRRFVGSVVLRWVTGISFFGILICFLFAMVMFS